MLKLQLFQNTQEIWISRKNKCITQPLTRLDQCCSWFIIYSDSVPKLFIIFWYIQRGIVKTLSLLFTSQHHYVCSTRCWVVLCLVSCYSFLGGWLSFCFELSCWIFFCVVSIGNVTHLIILAYAWITLSSDWMSWCTSSFLAWFL